MTLRDYLGVIWRRKWVVLLVVLVATGSAYFFSARQTKQYEANADLIYEQQLDVSNPLTGQSYTDASERNLELRSVGSILAGPDMIQRAAADLKEQGKPVTGFEISSAPVTDPASGSTLVRQQRRAHHRQQRGCRSLPPPRPTRMPRQFVDYRKESVQEQIQRAIDAVSGKLADVQGRGQGQHRLPRAPAAAAGPAAPQGHRHGQLPGDHRPRRSRPTPSRRSPCAARSSASRVGLFAGIGLAFLLEQFDTRLRRPDEIAELLRQPILGRVPRISRKYLGENALVTLQHPDGQVAESFRMVRTNLDFMAVDADIRSIVLTSCMQGEGKSVTVANLAVSMALAGKKVIVVDADLRRPRMHTYFGLRNEKGVSTVATGRDRLHDALQPVAVEPAIAGPLIAGLPELGQGHGCPRASLRAHERADPAQPRRDRRLPAVRGDPRGAGRRGRPACSSTRRRCSPSATRRRSPPRSTASSSSSTCRRSSGRSS